MIIGVLKEIKANEFRVAAVPETVAEIVAHGHKVLVQKDAGIGSGFTNEAYAKAMGHYGRFTAEQGAVKFIDPRKE